MQKEDKVTQVKCYEETMDSLLKEFVKRCTKPQYSSEDMGKFIRLMEKAKDIS